MARRYGKELGIFLLLLALCVSLAILNPRFLAPINLQNTARLIGMYGIFSLGVAMVIVTGGIDLSIGSMIALVGVFLSIGIVDRSWSPGLVAVGALGLGAALGWIHAYLVVRIKVQPFVVTLCGLLIYRGLARFIASDETKGFGTGEGFEWLRNLALGNVGGVPIPFVLCLLIAAVLFVVLHRSVYGRHLYATGWSEAAARYSGIDTQTVVGRAYIAGATLTALSAILFAFYTNSVSPSSHGNFFELYGIAAAVLGGFSLRGGEGSIIGVVLGIALLQVLQNLVNLLGIPSSLNFAVMGTVILLGVLADSAVRNRRHAATKT